MTEPDASSSNEPKAEGAFPSTLWTLVQAASHGPPEKSPQALHRLCEIYTTPILRFLERSGYKPEQAQDLTQGFIVHLIEKGSLAGFSRSGNKFRSFLLQCLKNFCRDEWRKETARKRGGGVEKVDVDDEQIGLTNDIEKSLDLDIAQTVHKEALKLLTAGKYAEAKKRERFEAFRGFIWGNDTALSYDEVGKAMQMSAGHVKKAVFDLRQHYFEAFRISIGEIVLRDAIEEETRYLLTLLAQSGRASEL